MSELEERGVREQASDLVVAYPQEKIRRAIKNFDERVAAGEDVTAGFLVADIRSEKGFAFRRKAGRKSEAVVRAAEKRRGELRKRQATVADAAQHERDEEREEVEAYLASLGEMRERGEFEQRAVARYAFHEQLERAREGLNVPDPDARKRAVEAYEAHRLAALKAHYRKLQQR